MATVEVESVPTTLPAAETQEVLTNTEEIKQPLITQEEPEVAALPAAVDPVVDEPTEAAEPAAATDVPVVGEPAAPEAEVPTGDAVEAKVVVEEAEKVELTEETKDENPEEEKKPEDLAPVVASVVAAAEEKPVDHEEEKKPVAEEPSTGVAVEKID